MAAVRVSKISVSFASFSKPFETPNETFFETPVKHWGILGQSEVPWTGPRRAIKDHRRVNLRRAKYVATDTTSVSIENALWREIVRPASPVLLRNGFFGYQPGDVIPQYADVLLLERSLGVMLFLVADGKRSLVAKTTW